MRLRLARPPAVGIAIAADRLVAALPGDGSAAPPRDWHFVFKDGGGERPPDELRTAFEALRAEWGDRPATVHVALLPPLVRIAELDLPRLRETEARRLLVRDAARYFLGVRSAQVVATLPASGERTRSGLVAAAVPAAWLESLHRAAGAAGWELDVVGAAQAAWCAAHVLWPTLRTEGALAVLLGDRVELLRLARGELAGVVELPVRGCDAPRLAGSLLDQLRGEPDGAVPPLALVGEPAERSELARALAAAGAPPLPGPDGPSAGGDPAVLAARFAARAADLRLLPDNEHEKLRLRRRRFAAAIWTAAGASLVLAALLNLWGERRELDHVRAERAAIRSSVEAVMHAHRLVDEVGGRLATVDSLERTAPRWSRVIAEVAERLPPDAHLAALRAHADSVLLEGSAGRVTGVYSAFRAAPGALELAPPPRAGAGSAPAPAAQSGFVLAARLPLAGGAEGDTP